MVKIKTQNTKSVLNMQSSSDLEDTDLSELKRLRKVDIKHIISVIHEARVKKLSGASLRKFMVEKLPFLSKSIMKILIQIVLTKGVEYLIKILLPI